MARISRGRTIREFVVFVLIVPTLVSTIWFVVMGGTAIDFQLNGVTDMGASLTAESRTRCSRCSTPCRRPPSLPSSSSS